MIHPAVQAEIEETLGRRIVSVAPLSAANNAHIYRLICEGGGKNAFVAKVAERGLDIEAWMLRYLREKSGLPVPDILYGNEHVILMEFVESHHHIDAMAQKDAARHLAALHRIHANRFGLERDTLIGALRQPNAQTRDWVAFFARHRLLYMAGEALAEGKIDKKVMGMVEKLAGKLGQYVPNTARPSLIHGDIWSGNVLAGRGRIAAFLDPAIYYADPEAELAFIRLFHTFDESFFAWYGEINPIAPGFAERADIYNIYPLLVHARLFGASYARRMQRMLEKFV